MTSSQIVVSKEIKFDPKILTVAYDCQTPNNIKVVDKDSRCTNKEIPPVPDEPVIYDLLAHSESD